MEIMDLLDATRAYYACCSKCGHCSDDYRCMFSAQDDLLDNGWAVIDDELICGECQ